MLTHSIIKQKIKNIVPALDGIFLQRKKQNLQALYNIILIVYKKNHQKNKKKVFFKKSQTLQKCEHRRKSSKRTHKRKTRKRYTTTTNQQYCSKHCKISPESAKNSVSRALSAACQLFHQKQNAERKQPFF